MSSATIVLAGINADITHMKTQKDRIIKDSLALAELTKKTQDESLAFANALDDVQEENERLFGELSTMTKSRAPIMKQKVGQLKWMSTSSSQGLPKTPDTKISSEAAKFAEQASSFKQNFQLATVRRLEKKDAHCAELSKKHAEFDELRISLEAPSADEKTLVETFEDNRLATEKSSEHIRGIREKRRIARDAATKHDEGATRATEALQVCTTSAVEVKDNFAKQFDVFEREKAAAARAKDEAICSILELNSKLTSEQELSERFDADAFQFREEYEGKNMTLMDLKRKLHCALDGHGCIMDENHSKKAELTKKAKEEGERLTLTETLLSSLKNDAKDGHEKISAKTSAIEDLQSKIQALDTTAAEDSKRMDKDAMEHKQIVGALEKTASLLDKNVAEAMEQSTRLKGEVQTLNNDLAEASKLNQDEADKLAKQKECFENESIANQRDCEDVSTKIADLSALAKEFIKAKLELDSKLNEKKEALESKEDGVKKVLRAEMKEALRAAEGSGRAEMKKLELQDLKDSLKAKESTFENEKVADKEAFKASLAEKTKEACALEQAIKEVSSSVLERAGELVDNEAVQEADSKHRAASKTAAKAKKARQAMEKALK